MKPLKVKSKNTAKNTLNNTQKKIINKAKKYILAIDQGTTGTTVGIFNSNGILLNKAYRAYPQIYPKPGWVEQDSNKIWATVSYTIKKLFKLNTKYKNNILAIGITNQRETFVPWCRETQEPLYNAIVWQCRRTSEQCNNLKKRGLEKKIRKITGLTIDPYFSASKMRWLLDNSIKVREANKKGRLCFGTIDSFIISRLTKGESFCTDFSNASRTGLLDITKLSYSEDLLKLYGIKKESLPEVLDSNSLFGKTKSLGFIPDDIPIYGVLGDQQSALFGQKCFKKLDLKMTFGTGSFLLLNTGANIVSSKNSLLSTIAWRLKGRNTTYALEGGAFMCGAAVQWFRDNLGAIKNSRDIEKLALSVESTDGVQFIPAFSGLGAPNWIPEAKAMILGMSRGTTKAHIARAILKSLAFQNVELVHAMESDLQTKIKNIKVDGGAVTNNLLMQMQADYLSKNIFVPENKESTLVGAAFMAGHGAGLWTLNELQKIKKKPKIYSSKLEKIVRDRHLNEWSNVVAICRLAAKKGF